MRDDSTSATLQSYFDSLLGIQPDEKNKNSLNTSQHNAVEAQDVDVNTEVEAKIHSDVTQFTGIDNQNVGNGGAADKPTGDAGERPAINPKEEQTAVSAKRIGPKNRDSRLVSKVQNEGTLSDAQPETTADLDLVRESTVPTARETRKTVPASQQVTAPAKQSVKQTSYAEFKPEQSNELLEEQKARLQKLLSQQVVAAEATEAQLAKTAELKQQIAKEFKVAQPLPQTDSGVETAEAPDVDLPVNAIESDILDDNTFHDEAAQQIKWHDNGRPQWAQERFEVLLFDVAGLTLAVPLVALGQIVRFSKGELTPIFGQSDWFMGLLNSSVGRLRVVNTSLFVMPEKYDKSFLESAEYAISLDGVQWALAVNKVNQPISLDPAEIKWRTERSKRSWLAGTVKSHMCALLDIPQMANMLNDSDKTLSTS